MTCAKQPASRQSPRMPKSGRSAQDEARQSAIVDALVEQIKCNNLISRNQIMQTYGLGGGAAFTAVEAARERHSMWMLSHFGSPVMIGVDYE